MKNETNSYTAQWAFTTGIFDILITGVVTETTYPGDRWTPDAVEREVSDITSMELVTPAGPLNVPMDSDTVEELKLQLDPEKGKQDYIPFERSADIVDLMHDTVQRFGR